jgi:hypothetical protein
MEPEKSNIQYGIIIGLIYVLLTLILYLIDRSLLASFWKAIPYLLVLGLLVYIGLQRKKELGGYLKFKEAVKTMFIVYFIAEVLFQLFNYSLYNFIDPELSAFMKEQALEKTKEGMENWGASEENTKEVIKNMKNQDYSLTLNKTVLGLAFWSILGFIYTLIVAVLIKKSPPEEEQEKETSQ